MENVTPPAVPKLISVRFPKTSVLMSLAVVLIAGLGSSKLEVSTDARVFFSDSIPSYGDLLDFEGKYSRRTRLLIAINNRRATIFEVRLLRKLHRLTELAWQLPYATQVESITNAVYIDSDPERISVSEMVPIDLIDNAELVKSRVMSDSLLVRRLIAQDEHTTGIVITFDYSSESGPVTKDIIDAVKKLCSDVGLPSDGISIWYGGRVALSNAFSQAARQDLTILTPISYAFMLFILAFMLRSGAASLALASTAMLAAVGALGVGGWAGYEVNIATGSATTIIVALGVASLMHFVCAYLDDNTPDSSTREQRISRAVRNNIKPVLIALSTTSIGFLCLNFSEAPPFQQLGNIVAAGSWLCICLGYFFLPPILLLVNPPSRSAANWGHRVTDFCSNLIIKHSRSLIFCAPIVVLALLSGILFTEINDNYNEYLDSRFEFRQHSDKISKNLSGLDLIDFDLVSARADGIFDPDYIDGVEKFETWLKAQPHVHHVYSISEIFARLDRHLRHEHSRSLGDGPNANTFAQYLLLYELSLPYGQNISDTITGDRKSSRLSVVINGAKSSDILNLIDRANMWVSERPNVFLPSSGTGLSALYASLTMLNVKSMIGGSFLGIVVISLTLIRLLGSVRLGLLSLIPNIVPAIVALGIWGYTKSEVGVAVSIVGVITLGIIVDDTVHILWRYREAQIKGFNVETSIRWIFASVGKPMLYSTLALGIGFGVVSSSGFLVTSAMGQLASMTIVIALIADWFLLVPIIVRLHGGESNEIALIGSGLGRHHKP